MDPAQMPLEIALIALVELLFGFGYNVLVGWLFRNRLMHVSISVVIGVAVTLLIPALVWFDLTMPFWQSGLLLVLCFAASGTPMIVGSMQRTVKDGKRRRKIGNTAGRIRDEIVMDLNALAQDIAEKSKDSTVMQDLPDFVNRIHGLIGSLKTL
jgi:Kef-type K+ transport system membrane component KefB